MVKELGISTFFNIFICRFGMKGLYIYYFKGECIFNDIQPVFNYYKAVTYMGASLSKSEK